MARVHRMVRPAADVLATTKALLARGKAEIIRPDYVRADLAGRCSCDLIVEQAGYGHLRIGTKSEEKYETGRTLSLRVPCRKCEPCLKAKRMLWTDRAVREYRASTRSWFVTLTFKPETRYRLRLMAMKRLSDSGGDFNSLSDEDQYAELVREYQRPVALYFMRLRKGLAKRGWAQTRFRYLLAPERHADHAPHFHVLLHEVDESMPLRKARIEEAWEHGVLHARLIKDERAARYVVKYLGKQDFTGRVRASQRYGEIADPDLKEQPFPGVRSAAPPAPLASDPAVARQRLREELGQELVPVGDRDDGVAEFSEGDGIALCELGLHIGTACTCPPRARPGEPLRADDPLAFQEAAEPPEQRERHSRERLSRRGWAVPMPRLLASVSEPASQAVDVLEREPVDGEPHGFDGRTGSTRRRRSAF